MIYLYIYLGIGVIVGIISLNLWLKDKKKMETKLFKKLFIMVIGFLVCVVIWFPVTIYVILLDR